VRTNERELSLHTFQCVAIASNRQPTIMVVRHGFEAERSASAAGDSRHQRSNCDSPKTAGSVRRMLLFGERCLFLLYHKYGLLLISKISNPKPNVSLVMSMTSFVKAVLSSQSFLEENIDTFLSVIAPFR